MDSDSPPHHHHYHHHQTSPHQHHQNQPMVRPTNFYPTTFTTAPPPPSSVPVMPQQQQHQNPNFNHSRFTFIPVTNSSTSAGPTPEYSEGSGSSPRIGAALNDPVRRKRGRPRKYLPDGGVALGLSPTPVNPISPVGSGDYSGGQTDYSGGATPSSEPPAKRTRGRPAGSVKKQLDALGSGGAGFTPHVLTVKAGEDVGTKVMAFAQQGPRTICILSAHGSISNVTLRQSVISGGTVTYEGRFQIISLTGSFIPSDSNNSRNRTGGLSVSLAGSDGLVMGGGVAGMLVAASPVQVVVGSFMTDGKKVPPPSPNMTTVTGAGVKAEAEAEASTTPSQDENANASSNSSDDNNGGATQTHYYSSNAGQQSMYTNMGFK